MSQADFIAPTLSDTATAAAPAANAAVVTLTTPAKGTYQVAIDYLLDGTAETQRVNLNLRKGSTVVADLITPGTAILVKADFFEIDLDGATSLTVNAVANATAGSVYTVRLVADRVG